MICSEVNVMHEVCPDPDHILDPGMSYRLTWGLIGISIELTSSPKLTVRLTSYFGCSFLMGRSLKFSGILLIRIIVRICGRLDSDNLQKSLLVRGSAAQISEFHLF